MHHGTARKIFEEIRNRPYAWSTQPGKHANNCYFKGVELLQRLGILGYAVRGRVGETFLDEKFPANIQRLYPTEFPLTHFWVEVQIEESWRALDASFDPPLARVGFIVNEWESNRTCFNLSKIYSQEETIAYQTTWNKPGYAAAYFGAIGPCATALNKWLESLQ